MNIKADLKRIEGASTELRQSQKSIDKAVSEIEEVIKSLKKDESEASQEMASKLTKTAESLRGKKRAAAMMAAALERTARMQRRCEERILSREDGRPVRIPKIHTQNISAIVKKASKVFGRI